MKSTIEQLQDNAKRHARRAAELRKRSAEIREAGLRGVISNEEARAKASELRQKAADEGKQAMNMMNFLRLYIGSGLHESTHKAL